MLKTSCNTYTTNEQALNNIHTERELLNVLKIRKSEHIGHIINKNNRMLKTTIIAIVSFKAYSLPFTCQLRK